MNRTKSSWRRFFAVLAMSAMTFGVLQSALIQAVSADTVPQAIPYAQDWSNVGLITANDDWSMVPGVVGYLGDYSAQQPVAVDPRTVLVDMTNVDVIANQANPDTQTSGGVAEFEITNPTVALQGSGTADAPNLVFYVNATGQSNIRFSCNLRDIDNSMDNAVQPVAIQYRVGTTGEFSNVPGGFVADASVGPTMTTSTPIAVTLPPVANNQPNVQIRVLTTNAPGSDEWIGVDDVSITSGGPVVTYRANADFNGDGRSDYAVTRDNVQREWHIARSGTNNYTVTNWGASNDVNTPADYDGDGRTDIAVWRPSNGTFYVLLSGTTTFRIEQFGLSGDDPTIVGDYNADGRADLAVYRPGSQGTFFYRTTPGGIVNYVRWGGQGATAVPGDYDGDGRYDFNVRSNTASEVFYLLKSTGGVEYVNWGVQGDIFVPGDYDGDGRFDFCMVRPGGSNFAWYILERDGGGTGASPIFFGFSSDVPAAGDYDGDGSQNIAVWRPELLNAKFFVRTTTGAAQQFDFGNGLDTPVAAWWNN
jgi:hypothetical protein